MRTQVPVLLFAAGVLSVGLGACGGEGSADTVTTVIREVQPTTVEKTTTVRVPAKKPATSGASTAPAPTPAPEAEPEEPPNVVGLALPQAKRLLSEAGFTASVRNTDTAFGIVVPANFTVCKQGEPRGDIVPILAQKYGC